jgi:hypothetical protein
MKGLIAMHRLSKHPRRTLAALATALFALAIAVGSGAGVTPPTANASHLFTSGVLKHSNSKDGTAILTLDKMKPTDSVTGSVTLTNTGDIPGTFTLSQSALVDTPGPNAGALSGKLDVTITDKGTNQVVYSGKLGAMTSKSLGTYAPGEAHTYNWVVSFPDGGTPASNTTGDNAYLGSSTGLTYDFTEVQ